MTSNLFNDSDITNVTPEELQAVQEILKSNRGAMLAKEIICTMSKMDDKATPYFLGLIPTISKIQIDTLNERIHTMRGTMGSLGRRLTADSIKSGKDKGTPKFLTEKFQEGTQLCAWEMLEYIQEFANFQEYAREVKFGGRSEMPTASRLCQCDALMRMYLLRFCKFLDDLETHDRDKLVSEQVFELNPHLWDIVLWHREHRSEWDDISPKKTKTRSRKGK